MTRQQLEPVKGLWDKTEKDILLRRAGPYDYEVWIETGYMTNDFRFVFKGGLAASREVARKLNGSKY